MKRKYCARMRERLREREGAPFLAVCHRTNPNIMVVHTVPILTISGRVSLNAV